MKLLVCLARLSGLALISFGSYIIGGLITEPMPVLFVSCLFGVMFGLMPIVGGLSVVLFDYSDPTI